MGISQFERLMCLHSMIRDGRYPSSQTIQKYFNVSTRTAHRDIHILKNLYKAPLAYDAVKHGFYYTIEGWSLATAADSRAKLLITFLD
jgi:predicted DNA-binding transcriptional regulator YafY